MDRPHEHDSIFDAPGGGWFSLSPNRPWRSPEDPHLRASGLVAWSIFGIAALLLLTVVVLEDPTHTPWLWAYLAAALVTEMTHLPISIHGSEHKVLLNDLFVLVPLVYFEPTDGALLLLLLAIGTLLILPQSWSMRIAHVTTMLAARFVLWIGAMAAIEYGAGPIVAVLAGLAAGLVYEITFFHPLSALLLDDPPFSYGEFLSHMSRVRSYTAAIEVPMAPMMAAAYPSAPWSLPLLLVPYLAVWRVALLAPQIEGLRDMDRMRTRFVATASHELQTPLTSIIGFADTLEARWDELDAGQKRGFLSIIREQGRRMARLVQDLLVLSRIDVGVPLKAERERLEPIVRAAIVDTALEDVEVDVPEDLCVFANGDQVQQIMVNLLTNARKYGEPPIEVHAHQRGRSGVELRVVDHGAGVPPELRRGRMFEQFSRGSNVASSVEGSGLGLSIVRALAHAQHGEVAYEDADDGGAVFVVELVAAGSEHHRPSNTPDAGSTPSS